MRQAVSEANHVRVASADYDFKTQPGCFNHKSVNLEYLMCTKKAEIHVTPGTK